MNTSDILALIGTIIALIGIIVPVVIGKIQIKQQKEEQKEQDAEQKKQQELRDTIQACEELRDLLDEWYRALGENINPEQSPSQILFNITKLDNHRRFVHKYSTLIGKIRASNEPLCMPIINSARIFHESALDIKGRIRIAFQCDSELNRLYRYYIYRDKEARKIQISEEEYSKNVKLYIGRLLELFKSTYFGADDELDKAMIELRSLIKN